MLVLEGLAMSFWLLLVCVVGIANGPIGLVVFYEKDVKDRVIQLGLTTPEKIKKSAILISLALFLPVLIFVPPVLVYFVNGARGFWDGFTQMTVIYLIMNLFDRLFIDWYWVGHTKAWDIKGTEDLKPYIPKKTLLKKVARHDNRVSRTVSCHSLSVSFVWNVNSDL